MAPSKQHPIPLWYRFPLLVIEPICALNGCYMLFFQPAAFLSVMSPYAPKPGIITNIAANSTTAAATMVLLPETLSTVRVLTDQLATMHLVFAINQAFVLNLARDIRMWRILCGAMLVCDMGHIAASLREVTRGGLGVAAGSLRGEDLLNFSVLVIMALLRLGVVLEVGLRKDAEAGWQAEMEAKKNK